VPVLVSSVVGAGTVGTEEVAGALDGVAEGGVVVEVSTGGEEGTGAIDGD
jgi:hypothetical protein